MLLPINSKKRELDFCRNCNYESLLLFMIVRIGVVLTRAVGDFGDDRHTLQTLTELKIIALRQHCSNYELPDRPNND